MSWTLEGVDAADLAASLGAVALDSSARAGLLLGGAGVVCALARRSPARWRHAVWVAAFAGAAALPILAVLDAGPAALARVGGPGSLALGALWLCGVLVLGLRQQLRGRRLHARLRGSLPGPPIPGARVRIGGDLASPVTFGWRSTVLLPTGFALWPPAHRRQVLLHEGAHVARRDWVVQRLVAALCHVFWFHPVLWVARRFLILEAERAADEAVLRAGVRPSDYAQLLLARASDRSPFPALAARRWLEIRVRSLLSPPGRPGATPVLGLLAVLALPPLLSGVTVSPAPPAPHCDVNAFAGEDLQEADPGPWLAAAEVVPAIPASDGDTAQASRVHDALNRQIAAMTPAESAFLRGAAQTLVRNCPYNRAGAGLPALIAGVMRPHFHLADREEINRTSPATRERLRALQGALESHLRLIDALGLDPLPSPLNGDYLAGRDVWETAPQPIAPASRTTLLASAARRTEEVRDLVDAYDPETEAVINQANTVLQLHTDKHWPMKDELLAYRTTLTEISAMAGVFANEGNVELRDELKWLQEDCDALIGILDVWFRLMC